MCVCMELNVCLVGIAKHKHKTSILVVLRESTLASHLALLRPLQRHSTHSARPSTHTHRGTPTHTHTHIQTWPQSAPCSLTCYFRFRIRFVCCRRRNLTKSHVANASSSRSLAKKALRASIRSIRVIVPLVGILRASSRPAIGSRWQHPFSCWLSCEFSFGAFGGGEQLHLCISHRTFIVIPSARSCCFVLVFVAKFRGIFS